MVLWISTTKEQFKWKNNSLDKLNSGYVSYAINYTSHDSVTYLRKSDNQAVNGLTLIYHLCEEPEN